MAPPRGERAGAAAPDRDAGRRDPGGVRAHVPVGFVCVWYCVVWVGPGRVVSGWWPINFICVYVLYHHDSVQEEEEERRLAEQREEEEVCIYVCNIILQFGRVNRRDSHTYNTKTRMHATQRRKEAERIADEELLRSIEEAGKSKTASSRRASRYGPVSIPTGGRWCWWDTCGYTCTHVHACSLLTSPDLSHPHANPSIPYPPALHITTTTGLRQQHGHQAPRLHL